MMDKIFTCLALGLLAFVVPLAAQPTTTFSIEPASTTAQPGDVFEISVTVSDFENINSVQYAVKWDSTILEYQEITFANDTDFPGLSDVPGVNLSVPGPGSGVPGGQINVSWFEPSFQPITVSDGTTMFSFNVEAIGCGDTDIFFDDPGGFVMIEILGEDSQGNSLTFDLVPENGMASVQGGSCGGSGGPAEVSFDIGDSTADQGGQACVDVSVTDFTDIGSTQLSITYDENILEFDEVTAFNLPGLDASDFDTSTPGVVTMDWSQSSGATVSDGTSIFQLCFNGTAAGSSSIAFSDTPLPISLQDNSGESVDFNGSDGNITINSTGGGGDLALFVGSQTVQQGDNFCLQITADNYNDIAGMGFSLSYDPALLSYTGIENINSGLVGFTEGGSTNNPNPGTIAIQYVHPTLQGVTLPNDAVLFEICFTAESCGTSDIATSNFIAQEFVNSNEEVVPATINSGSATVEGCDQGGCPPTTDLFLTIPDTTVNPGDSFCVPVEVCNFTDVQGMSFVIEYDTSLLQFDQFDNLNSNLPVFTVGGSVANPSPGRLTVTYAHPTLGSVTLDDGSVLMELCFTALGEGVEADLEFTGDFMTPFEFIDSNEEDIPADSEEGEITFTGTFDGLTISAEGQNVTPGEEFCMAFTTQNFVDIQGMSFTITYDPDHLSYEEVTNTNSSMNGFTPGGNFFNPEPGIITVLWTEPTASSVDLADGSVLFEICFTALGADGSCSEVDFDDMPTSIEITDSNEEIVENFLDDDDVCVDDDVAGQVQASIGNANVEQGASFCVPLTVDNFNNVTDFSFTIEYDETVLELDDVTDLTNSLANFTSSGNIDTSTPGAIGISWDNSGTPVTLPDDEQLLSLCFNAIGMPEECSDISFTGFAEPISFTSSTMGMLSFDGDAGQACINPDFEGFLLTIADETVQPGESFCLPVTVLNFENIAGFSFGIAFDNNELEFQSINNINPNVPGYEMGNFGLPGTGGVPQDIITTTWFEPTTVNSIDLPDGAVLFEICFEAIGDDGTTTQLDFSGTPTGPIDINDGVNQIDFNGESGTVDISAIQPPSIGDVDITNVSCNGGSDGSISIAASGGTGGPFSYSWSNNATGATINGLEAGSYTVVVTDNGNGGLTTMETYQIAEPGSALSVSGGVTAPTCVDGSNGSVNLTIEGGTPDYNIQWDNGIQSGQTNPSNLPAGTYCTTITDANGCTAESCFTVPQGTGDGPSISASIDEISCAGDSDGAISLMVSNTIGSPTYLWNTTPQSQGAEITGLADGSYTVTVIDEASCRTIETFDLSEPPVISLSPDITEVSCKGESSGSIQISASGGNGGFSYQWSGPNNYSNTGSTITTLAAGTYNVTATDANQCQVTATAEVTEPSDALAIGSIVPGPVDNGSDGTVDLEVSGGSSPYTYSWSGPNNFTSTSEDLANLSDGGSYCVTVTDSRGCTTTGCAEVINALRITSSSIVDACPGATNGSITVAVSGGMMPYSYNWGGVTPNPGTPAAFNLPAGNYTVTITDNAGSVLTRNFLLNEAPPINVNPSVVPVNGDPGNTNGSITLNASGGAEPLSFSWSGPGGFTSSSSSISNLGTGEYCVSVTDSNLGNNCSWDTCFEVIYVQPMSAPELTAVGTTCSYTDDGSLTVNIQGGVAPYTVLLTTSEGEELNDVVQDNTASFDNLPSGSTQVQVTDALGNSVPASNIMITQPMPLALSSPLDYQHATGGNCDGMVEIEIEGGTPPYSVEWSNTSETGPSLEGLCGGEWYTPTITDANGCILGGPDSILINEFSLVLESTTGTDCPDDNNGAADITVEGGDPGYTYQWVSMGNTVSEVEDPQDLPAGDYTVIVSEPSGNSLTLEVTIEPVSNLAVTASPVSDYNGFEVSCPDAEDGQVSATASGSSGYLYEWTDENGFMVGMEPEVDGLAAGTYNLLVSDEFGCTSSSSVTLEAPDSMIIEGLVQNVRCEGGSNGIITLDIEGGASPFSYFWDNDAIGDRIALLPAKDYIVTVVDDNNCEKSDTFTVEEPEPISLTFESEPATDGCNGSLFVTADGGTGPYTYDWEAVMGDNNDQERKDLCPGEYLVQVEDANGCLSSLTTGIVDDRRNPCLEERVVITPDGNGSNDEFQIFCVEDFPENRLEIYNRWGQLVFETVNYDNSWMGTREDGSELPAGPYYYILEYDDAEGNLVQQKGSLTILRED